MQVQDGGGVSTTRPSSKPNSQTSMNGGFAPRAVECGADLASVVCSVVYHLGEAYADRGMLLIAIAVIDFLQDNVRIKILRQEPRPGSTISLHRCPEFGEIRVIFVEENAPISIQRNRYQESEPTTWRCVSRIDP